MAVNVTITKTYFEALLRRYALFKFKKAIGALN